MTNSKNTIIQWNCNGLKNNLSELQIIRSNLLPVILALQETHLKPDEPFRLRGYRCFRKDVQPLQRAQGGVALFIRNNIPVKEIRLISELQVTAVQIESPLKVTICNFYLPDGNWQVHDIHNIIDQLPRPVLIVGDFNAHSPLWGSLALDTRGRRVESILEETNMILLNNGKPTRFNARTGETSAIDISFCSPQLAVKLAWNTLNDLHSSDHFPININLNFETRSFSIKERWLPGKANWDKYAGLVNFPDASSDINNDVKIFTKIITDAAKASIPMTKPTTSHRPVPWWNEDIKKAISERKRCYNKLKRHPSQENLITFKKSRAVARRLILHSKKSSWEEFVSTVTPEVNLKEIWRKIRIIAGKNTFDIPESLMVNAKLVQDMDEITESFAKHFEQNSNSGIYAEDFLEIKTNEERMVLDFSSDQDKCYNSPLTLEELEHALNTTTESAAGHDNILYSMLKNLHETEKQKLLQLFNNILDTGIYPCQWKIATVIPILKIDKPACDPCSYRPISLTSCMGKVFEKIINGRLTWWLESNSFLDQNQLGCRSKHSTVDALVFLENEIQEAFYNREHLVAICFDLQKAYDRTWRHSILKQIYSWGLRGKLPIILGSFLKNRSFFVRVGTVESSIKTLENGVPQGSVLSVTLFAIAINFLLHKRTTEINKILYVDDLILTCKHTSIDIINEVLNNEIENISRSAHNRGFLFSREKTQCTHFCRLRTQHAEPTLQIQGHPIEVKDSIKILGMIFDKKLHWSEHITYLVTKCQKALNIIKCMANIRWGADRQILLNLVQSIIQGRMDYGAIVYNSCRPSRLKQLDRLQLTSLRIATGAFRTSPAIAVLADASAIPLDLRRNYQTMVYASQIMSRPLHINHIKFNSTNEYSNRTTITRPTRIRNDETCRKFEFDPPPTLPEYTPSVPPWKLILPIINTSLSKWKKDKTLPSTYRSLFKEEMDRYKLPNLIIYTDGSKTSDGVGSAIVVDNQEYSWSLSSYCSVYTAELYAIWQALLFFSFTQHNMCVIYSDSLSAIQSLKNKFTQSPLCINILQLTTHLISHDKNINIVWIPGHCQIDGNEKADNAARHATNEPTDNGIPIPLEDLRAGIKDKIKQTWQNRWSSYDGQLRQYKPKIDKWTYPRLTRREQVVLCRIRITHTNKTHLYLLAGAQRPRCEHCNERLSVNHIFVCPHFHQQRQTIGPLPEIENILKDNNQSVKKILTYLKEIKVFDQI